MLLVADVVYGLLCEQGALPLHWAATNGRAEVVRVLLESGASVHSTNSDVRGKFEF